MSDKKYTLSPLENYKPIPGPVICVVMDGVGLGNKDESDGVHLAYTPLLDELMANEPLYCELKAHGTAVGMPTGYGARVASRRETRKRSNRFGSII